MRWGSDDIGVVLTRNEIWLLLHALAEASVPPVDWEGNRVEPWVVGELRSRLQSALRPEPLSDVEERPVIRLDSEMGRSLAQAGVRPLVLSDGYDLGSLVAACAERGWGVELRLPVGAGPVTPAEAVVTVGKGQEATDEGKGQRANGKGDEDVPPTDDGSRTAAHEPRSFVGLERPVVALARALLGAAGSQQPAFSTALTPDPASDRATALTPDPAPAAGRGESTYPQPTDHQPRTPDHEPRTTDPDVYLVPAAAINAGERDALLRTMAAQGWELLGEDATGVRFRRARGTYDEER